MTTPPVPQNIPAAADAALRSNCRGLAIWLTCIAFPLMLIGGVGLVLWSCAVLPIVEDRIRRRLNVATELAGLFLFTGPGFVAGGVCVALGAKMLYAAAAFSAAARDDVVSVGQVDQGVGRLKRAVRLQCVAGLILAVLIAALALFAGLATSFGTNGSIHRLFG